MNEVTTGSSGFDITTAKAKIEQKFGRWTWVVGLIVAILLGPVFWAAAYAVRPRWVRPAWASTCSSRGWSTRCRSSR